MGSARNPDRTMCWEFFSYHGLAGLGFDWMDSVLYHLTQYTITAYQGHRSLNMEGRASHGCSHILLSRGCIKLDTGFGLKTDQEDTLIVEQIWTGNAWRNFNYLIACPETGEALAVDPLDHEKCLGKAKEMGWDITQVLNTH